MHKKHLALVRLVQGPNKMFTACLPPPWAFSRVLIVVKLTSNVMR